MSNAHIRRGHTDDVACGERACDQHRPDRDIPAHQRPSRRVAAMFARITPAAKLEHFAAFTFRLAAVISLLDRGNRSASLHRPIPRWPGTKGARKVLF